MHIGHLAIAYLRSIDVTILPAVKKQRFELTSLTVHSIHKYLFAILIRATYELWVFFMLFPPLK